MKRIKNVYEDVLDGILKTLREYEFEHSERVDIAKKHITRRIFCEF